MGSLDKNKIALGVVGAAGVIFISYLLLKKLGGKSKAQSSEKKRKDSQHGQTSPSYTQDLDSQPLLQKDVEEIASKSELSVEDPNQISFVVLDQNGDNQAASSKKSDRSSDESSYDVVEADDVEGKSSRERDFEESLVDENETSTVILESDPIGIEESSSSLYHSAEETESKDEKEEESILSPEKDSSREEHFSSPLSESKMGSQNDQADSDSPDGKSVKKSLIAERIQGFNKSSSPSSYTATASIQFNKEKETPKTVKPQAITKVISPALKENKTTELQPEMTPVVDVPQEVMSKELSSDEIAAVLSACQNHPMSVSKDQIYDLVLLLRKNNPALQPAVLDSLVRVSAFTQNNLNLRGAGCESVICQQVVDQCTLILQQGFKDDTQLVSLAKVLTNLSMDPKATVNLERCVSPLIDVLNQSLIPASVHQCILRPLINLCSQDNFHSYYIPAITRLYSLLDSGSNDVRLLSVKVLVNLSINESMVPQMLSARAPSRLLDLVDKPTHSDLILRVVTLIGNLRAVIAKLQIDQSSLPSANKAESPWTMYTSICGVVKEPLLRNKVYRLTRHSDEDIRTQASKLYRLVTMAKRPS